MVSMDASSKLRPSSYSAPSESTSLALTFLEQQRVVLFEVVFNVG